MSHKSVRKQVDGDQSGVVARMVGAAPLTNKPGHGKDPVRAKATPGSAPDRTLNMTSANVLNAGPSKQAVAFSGHVRMLACPLTTAPHLL